MSGKQIVLNLGYSHPVKIEIPETVSVEVVQNTTINLKSKKVVDYLQYYKSYDVQNPKGKGIL
jgi:large subunit ribosomal protein L6